MSEKFSNQSIQDSNIAELDWQSFGNICFENIFQILRNLSKRLPNFLKNSKQRSFRKVEDLQPDNLIQRCITFTKR